MFYFCTKLGVGGGGGGGLCDLAGYFSVTVKKRLKNVHAKRVGQGYRLQFTCKVIAKSNRGGELIVIQLCRQIR